MKHCDRFVHLLYSYHRTAKSEFISVIFSLTFRRKYAYMEKQEQYRRVFGLGIFPLIKSGRRAARLSMILRTTSMRAIGWYIDVSKMSERFVLYSMSVSDARLKCFLQGSTKLDAIIQGIG